MKKCENSGVIRFYFDEDIILSIGINEGRHYCTKGKTVEIGIKENGKFNKDILIKMLGVESVNSTVEAYACEETFWRIARGLNDYFSTGYDEWENICRFASEFFTYDSHDTSGLPVQSLNNTYEENARLVAEHKKEKQEGCNSCDCFNDNCKVRNSLACGHNF